MAWFGTKIRVGWDIAADVGVGAAAAAAGAMRLGAIELGIEDMAL